jgi:hypothetical protein
LDGRAHGRIVIDDEHRKRVFRRHSPDSIPMGRMKQKVAESGESPAA